MSDPPQIRKREGNDGSILVRYVELHIHGNSLDEARRLLRAQAPLVRNCEGCFHLEINECLDDPGIFSTYSYWTNAEVLEQYRKSEVFREFWNRMKPMFLHKAQARSFVHLVAPM